MDLTEVGASSSRPFRCFVRGDVLRTEDDDVQTLGFKDGVAVVQVMADKAVDKDTLDLTKLKKIVVKVDPSTGRKYIFKDGRKIEIVSKASANVIAVKPGSQIQMEAKPAIAVKSPQMLGIVPPTLAPLPKLAPLSGNKTTIRTIDNVKYHVLSVNVKKPGGGRAASVATMTETAFVNESAAQTERVTSSTACTQTEPCTDDRGSPFTDQFINFIIGDEDAPPRKMIDPNRLISKEEIDKFNFFNDMRKALIFDRSGNLPIHDSVMQNNMKTLVKNCVILKAIKESVNIANQQGFAPLHLAVIHDVDVDVIKVLLSHGADLLAPDGDGNTAIHLAVEKQRSAMLKVLVSGAFSTRLVLNAFNYEGFTPLILACLNGCYDDAKLLLVHGADPNVKDMKSGRTALFHAAEAHDIDLVELLMQHKADTKIRNFFGTSPHDAMFELEEIPLKIKFCILGRDHQRFQMKKKLDGRSPGPGMKKAKLETTPVLRKVSSSDMMIKTKRK